MKTVLKISNLGLEILKGKEKLFLDSDKLGIASKIQEEETELGFDELIYEKFRTLRREIALESEVPAYVIFGDKTLKEFANKLPISKEQMLEINGVGLVKYEKYGESFLTKGGCILRLRRKDLMVPPYLSKVIIYACMKMTDAYPGILEFREI